jgi:GT2 family glycosyltransferase
MLTYDVVIPTYCRTSCLLKALNAISKQSLLPKRVVIIDASDDDVTKHALETYHSPFQIDYEKNELGRGNTPNSRNKAMRYVSADIVAYLDDDSYPRQTWAESMLGTYSRFPEAVAVGGRTLNGVKYEELQPVNDVGKIHANGRLSGNFAAPVDAEIDIDHMIGANSSWRTDSLRQLGGHFDSVPPGPFGLLEETEVCLRARKLGWRIVFSPGMIADHEGAPQPKSTRFSLKYGYQHARNSTFTYLRVYGLGGLFFRYALRSHIEPIKSLVRSVGGAIIRCFLELTGFVAGIIRFIKYSLTGS